MPDINIALVEEHAFSEVEAPWEPPSKYVSYRLSVALFVVISIVLALSIALKAYIFNNPDADFLFLKIVSFALMFAIYGAFIYLPIRLKKQRVKELPSLTVGNLAWQAIANGERGWLVFRKGWLIFQSNRFRFRISPLDLQEPQKAIENWKRRRQAPLTVNDKFGLLIVPMARPGRLPTNAVPWKQFTEEFEAWLNSPRPSGTSLLPPVREEQFRNMSSIIKGQVLRSIASALMPSLTFGVLLTIIVRDVWPESASPLRISLMFALIIWLVFLAPTFETIDYGTKAIKRNRVFDMWAQGKRVVCAKRFEDPI